MIARFSVINDERGLILGKQLGDVFEPGIIYEATKILDEIILRPVGRARIDGLKGPHPGNMYTDVNTMVYYGNHVVTEDEYSKLISDEKNSNKFKYGG